MTGIAYLLTLVLRRYLKPAPKEDPEALKSESAAAPKSLFKMATKLSVDMSAKFKPVLEKVKATTPVTEKPFVEDIESKGSLEPSDSEVIRDILANGAIPWVIYDPKAKVDNAVTTSPSTDETATASGETTEADITDKSHTTTLTLSESVNMGPIVHLVPDILISPCFSVQNFADVNFHGALPDSPVVVQPFSPATDYLQIPIPTSSRSKASESSISGLIVSAVTGKQFMLGILPLGKRKALGHSAGRVGQTRPFVVVPKAPMIFKTPF
ncbi:hypothetical protein EUX98_g9760 [Antrodiella citrinella]|uniref:Uncharacterized protein n=1 Tax=Antrodiella citrinella TaxID=2447956 RepID=A0A4V3XEC0_9APHY|nr:hypothetical protein EUX98_g9760 [Antrodiella citrinella]